MSLPDRRTAPGAYRCASCGASLFHPAARFDAGTGFPTFAAPTDEAAIRLVVRDSYDVRRLQVKCASCDAHLGHRFDDGDRPGGVRYCIARDVLCLDD